MADVAQSVDLLIKRNTPSYTPGKDHRPSCRRRKSSTRSLYRLSRSIALCNLRPCHASTTRNRIQWNTMSKYARWVWWQPVILEDSGPTTRWSQVTRQKGNLPESPIEEHDEIQRPIQAEKPGTNAAPSPEERIDDVDIECRLERREKGSTWDRNSPIRGAVRPRCGLCRCSLHHLSSAAAEQQLPTVYAGICWSSVDLCYF